MPILVPVILAGGSGTRLWPLSRDQYPKQFLSLAGDNSLLEDTLKRAMKLTGAEHPMVICREEHRFLVAEQMRHCGVTQPNVMLEPTGRDTAPAVAAACIDAVQAHGPDVFVIVLPSDHVISKMNVLRDAIAKGVKAAEHNFLVTFGIVPDSPRTGYGYIRAGETLMDDVRRAAEFVEKPDSETAQRYVDSGDYSWNSGMFLFHAGTFLEALAEHSPEVAAAVQEAHEKGGREDVFLKLDAEAFEACPKISIDYAVMEKAHNVAVVPLDAGWNDIGSWSAISDVRDKDEDGNVRRGDTVALDTRNSVLWSEGRLVATLGINNAVIVETADAVLVADRSRAERIKDLVNELGGGDRTEVRDHLKVYRPWGSYETIALSTRFQVKQIIVEPHRSLSLQMHHHRAEHWIVVSGTARVTRGDDSFILTEDQSTYIPLGMKHRLENPGSIPLHLIEVQSGSYLGEDDIVRFEDSYGRGNEKK